MKNSYFIFLFLLSSLFSSNSSAQLWYLTRGLSSDEVAWAVDADSAGNIYWAVEEKDRWPYWYFNIILYKIDSSGYQVWQSASYGGTYNDIAFIVKVNSNKIYLAGRSDTSGALGSANALVSCYNINDGSFNWDYGYDQGFGYEEIDGLIVQPDGIYLTGWTKGQTTDEDFLIQKISLNGSLIWTNSWDYNNQFDGANGHGAMDDNFIFAAGHTSLLNGSLACFSRLNGAYQWDVTWSGSSNDEVLGMTMSSDSMLYTVGYYSTPSTNSQANLRKFSRTGQLQWSRIWGGTSTEDCRATVTDGDSIIYVVGTTGSYGNGEKDIFVLKYDSAGTLLDLLFWGGAYDEVAKDVVMYGDYLYITGETESFGNGQVNGDHKTDGLLLKINGSTMQAPDSTMTNVTSPSMPIHGFNLQQNYPNPFNPSTTIEFALPKSAFVTLKVYNLLGEEVATLIAEQRSAGIHWFNWDAGGLASGVYLYRLEAGNFVQSKKLILMR